MHMSKIKFNVSNLEEQAENIIDMDRLHIETLLELIEQNEWVALTVCGYYLGAQEAYIPLQIGRFSQFFSDDENDRKSALFAAREVERYGKLWDEQNNPSLLEMKNNDTDSNLSYPDIYNYLHKTLDNLQRGVIFYRTDDSSSIHSDFNAHLCKPMDMWEHEDNPYHKEILLFYFCYCMGYKDVREYWEQRFVREQDLYLFRNRQYISNMLDRLSIICDNITQKQTNLPSTNNSQEKGEIYEN